ncbi:hypothetical protein [Blastococcus sp. SYSU D00820]
MGGDTAVTASAPERPSRRPAIVLIAVLGVLIVGGVVAYLLVFGFGSDAPGSDLEGRWTGTQTVASCEAVVCPPGEEAELVVECSWTACTVEVFDDPVELEPSGDGVSASGSVPPWALDSCVGGGFVTGRWALDLRLDGETLTGRYTEEVTSGCGPVGSRSVSVTESSWDLTLTRA